MHEYGLLAVEQKDQYYSIKLRNHKQHCKNSHRMRTASSWVALEASNGHWLALNKSSCQQLNSGHETHFS